MKILYIGDIYGQPGVKIVQEILPGLKKQHKVDFVIAQAENVSEGRGMTREDMKTLQNAGIDFFTGGNWSLAQDQVLIDGSPVIRPANYPEGTPGLGYKRVKHSTSSIFIISLLGKIVGKDAAREVDNPLEVVDKILETEKQPDDIVVVNFHGDYSSEKRIVGYYLDGRVTAVVGDHWHVPTADALVLPKSTAHITDVGMCGTVHSSLGVKLDVVIPRWRYGKINKNEVETEGPLQFNSVLIEVNEKTGLAKSIEPIKRTL